MVTVPADCPRATPAVLTVATLVFDDDQVTDELMVCLDPSLKVAVAVNCNEDPGAMSPEVGVSEIELKVAELTVRGADPVADAPA